MVGIPFGLWYFIIVHRIAKNYNIGKTGVCLEIGIDEREKYRGSKLTSVQSKNIGDISAKYIHIHRPLVLSLILCKICQFCTVLYKKKLMLLLN